MRRIQTKVSRNREMKHSYKTWTNLESAQTLIPNTYWIKCEKWVIVTTCTYIYNFITVWMTEVHYGHNEQLRFASWVIPSIKEHTTTLVHPKLLLRMVVLHDLCNYVTIYVYDIGEQWRTQRFSENLPGIHIFALIDTWITKI